MSAAASARGGAALGRGPSVGMLLTGGALPIVLGIATFAGWASLPVDGGTRAVPTLLLWLNVVLLAAFLVLLVLTVTTSTRAGG